VRTSFFPVEERTPSALNAPPTADRISSLFERPGACVVRGLYTPAELAPVVSALDAASDASPLRFRFSPRFEAYSFGRILDQAGDLEEYLREAERYRALCGELLGAEWLEPRLFAQLQALAGGVSLEVPVHRSGRSYLFASVRNYPPDGLVPPHFEIEQLSRPTLDELTRQIEEDSLLSFIALLGEPEAGGELTIYDVLRGSEVAKTVLASRERAAELLAPHPHLALELRQGDFVLFNGGARFHEVRRVVGSRSRWTLGGFCARRRGGGYLVFS
jgi:hypothetical protein